MSKGYLKTSWFGLPDGLPKLTPAGRAVLSMISWWAHVDGTNSYLSEANIAKGTGLSERAVRKQISILKGARYISCERKKLGKDGCKTMNIYRLLFPVNVPKQFRSDRNDVPIGEGGKRNDVPIGEGGKRNDVPPNRNNILMGRSEDNRSASLCYAERDSVLAVAVKHGIPKSFAEYFCDLECNKDLRKGQEGRIVAFWDREFNKDKFIHIQQECEFESDFPRKIREEDL